MTEPKLDGLPADILAIITSMLHAADAQRLSGTSRKLRRDIGFAAIRPSLELCDELRWVDRYHGRFPYMGPKLPDLFGTKTHTIRLECRMWCARCASCDGARLYIVADNNNRNCNESSADATATDEGFGNRRLVATSPYAKAHSWTEVAMEFCPRPGESYRIWYSVPPGNGTFRTHDLAVSYFIQNDFEKGARNAVSFLRSAGLWEPPINHASYFLCQTLVSVVAKCTLDEISEGHEPDSLVATLFELYDLDKLDKPSLGSLSHLIGEIVEYFQNEHFKEDKFGGPYCYRAVEDIQHGGRGRPYLNDPGSGSSSSDSDSSSGASEPSSAASSSDDESDPQNDRTPDPLGSRLGTSVSIADFPVRWGRRNFEVDFESDEEDY